MSAKTARELANQKRSDSDRPRANERLFELRKSFGLSLRDVRSATGLTISMISEMENGTKSPSVVTALKLARFYESTVEELFGHLLEERS